MFVLSFTAPPPFSRFWVNRLFGILYLWFGCMHVLVVELVCARSPFLCVFVCVCMVRCIALNVCAWTLHRLLWLIRHMWRFEDFSITYTCTYHTQMKCVVHSVRRKMCDGVMCVWIRLKFTQICCHFWRMHRVSLAVLESKEHWKASQYAWNARAITQTIPKR